LIEIFYRWILWGCGVWLHPVHLITFAVVVETGSLRQAARVLALSQPAISHQLRRLQDAVGAPLYRRVGRGIELTEAGRALYRYARKVRTAWARAERFAAEMRGGVAGRVRLRASRTTAMAILPRALALFRKRFPDVEIWAESGNSQEVVEAMSRLDLGLIETPHPPEHHRCCEIRRLGWDEVVALVPQERAEDCRVWPVERLCEHELVLREKGSGTREAVELAAAQAGIRVADRLCLGGTDAVIAACREGLGVGLVSRLALLENDPAGLAVVSLQPPIQRPITLLVRHDAPVAAWRLAEAIEEAARSLLMP